MKYYKVPEEYLEGLTTMAHKYLALREAYCYLDEDVAIDKYVKVFGDDATLDEFVSSTMNQYEDKYGIIEEEVPNEKQ